MRTIRMIIIIIVSLYVGAVIGRDRLNTVGSTAIDKTITCVKISSEYIVTKWNAEKKDVQ